MSHHLNFVMFEDRIFNLDRIEYFFVDSDYDVRAKFIGVEQSVFVVKLSSRMDMETVFYRIQH